MFEQNALLAKRIFDILLNAGNILIISHKKPDGDTLGSACALSLFLDGKGKRNYIFCVDEPQEEFVFLPNRNKIISDTSFLFTKRFGAVVVVDSGDPNYTGISDFINGLESSSTILINIDHHATNTGFGNYNFVDETAASTTEIIYRMMRWTDIPLNREIAVCLLTGILTDTYMFSNPATNFSSLEVASNLVSYGVRVHKIIEQLDRVRTFNALNLWGEVLAGLTINERLNVAIAIVTEEKLSRYRVDEHETDGLANFVSHYCKMPIIMVLKQVSSTEIKGSLRTTHSDIDVADIARAFGGGGHKKAAGFTVEGRLVEKDGAWFVKKE